MVLVASDHDATMKLTLLQRHSRLALALMIGAACLVFLLLCALLYWLVSSLGLGVFYGVAAMSCCFGAWLGLRRGGLFAAFEYGIGAAFGASIVLAALTLVGKATIGLVAAVGDSEPGPTRSPTPRTADSLVSKKELSPEPVVRGVRERCDSGGDEDG